MRKRDFFSGKYARAKSAIFMFVMVLTGMALGGWHSYFSFSSIRLKLGMIPYDIVIMTAVAILFWLTLAIVHHVDVKCTQKDPS